MNKVILIGRLTRDPEIRYTTNGDDQKAVARYTLAVDRFGKDKTADFIGCVTFGKSAEFAEKYLHKGTKIAIEGRIQTGSYEKQDGTKVYTTNVIVEKHEFVESKAASSGSASTAAETAPEVSADGFMSIPDGIDEALPFK
jgi:single-strand DNA-binding protein